MNSRINRINELIKEELSKIILKEIEFPRGSIATITRTKTVPNLSETFVYLSVIGEGKEQILNALQKNVYHLQKELNKKLYMRPVPKIVFKRETEEAEKIERILEKIKKK